jgi:hypothetical protein
MEAVPDQDGNRSPKGLPRADARSAVTNGKRLFVEKLANGRSPWARRMRDVIALHVADQGGLEILSEARRSLIRRAATITTELERLEARFASDEAGKDDFDAYQRGANTLRRLLEAIGLDRVPRDATPDMRTYLAGEVQ